MKVIFGGAFNPVTNAHMDVFKYVTKKIKVDEFIFLPVSSAYTKSDLASNYHRKNMLELAIEGCSNVRVSEMEMTDSDFLGTYQSLIRFSDGENCEIGFVIGADNLLGMEHWINIEGILSEFKIIVLGRNGLDIEKLIKENKVLNKQYSNFIICDDFNVEISSTGFRETMNKNDVPDQVFKYIIENDLFSNNDL